jgi:hypothetical protein
MNRAESLRGRKPELTVDLFLYPTDCGGRSQPIGPGWGCPCTIQQEEGSGWIGYDGWPLLGERMMSPGETRRVGMVFLSGQDAVSVLSRPGKFFLWEGRLIGEATIVQETT